MKWCPVCTTPYPDAKTNCDVDRAPLVASQELQPGALVNNTYEIVRTIGEGGFGIVYLARLLSTGAPRALKFLSSQIDRDPNLLKRFRQEAGVEIIHSNVVRIYDSGYSADGSPFISMEYVDGRSLREVVGQSPMPIERALALARGIASGLAEAHSLGVLHRDIKPENILVASPGPREVPKILDFGIAAVRDSVTSISRTRGLMFTPEYAAPEQWEGMAAADMDARVDLYAFGGVLYEMFTGRLNFYSETSGGWMYQHLEGERVPPSRLRPELAQWPGLDQLILSLLARNRDHRPRDARAVLRDLETIHHQPLLTHPATIREVPRHATQVETAFTPKIVEFPVAPLQQGLGSRTWSVGLIGAAVVAAVVVGIFFVSGNSGHTEAPPASANGAQAPASPPVSTASTPSAQRKPENETVARASHAIEEARASTELDIECDTDCTRYLDNSPQPARAVRVSAGEHDIRAVASADPSVADQTSLNVRAGETNRFTFKLLPKIAQVASGIEQAKTQYRDNVYGDALATLDRVLALAPNNQDARKLKETVLSTCRPLEACGPKYGRN